MSDKILQEDGFGLLLEDGSGYLVKEDAAPLDIDFTIGTLDPRITFTRGSTATYYNSSGLIASAASGAPRFDYDPVALTPRGLLLEEQRTNYALYSVPQMPAWTVESITLTTNSAVAPDGTTTATNLVEYSNNAEHRIYQFITFPTGVKVYSLYAKAGSRRWLGLRNNGATTYANFDLIAGVVGQAVAGTTIQNVGNGWYRCTVPVGSLTTDFITINMGDADTGSGPSYVYAGNGTGNLYVWGAQGEVGSVVSSYIPTTSAAVTRAADTAEMTGTNFSSWYNASAGTFVAEYRPQSISGTQPIISVNDTTANEAIRLYGSGTDPKAIVVDGGATQADLDAGTITVNTFAKLGLAFTLNDFAASFDGGTAVTDVAGTLPTVTQLQFHTDIAGNVANLHIKRLQFFSTRKSDSELRVLTRGTLDIDFTTGTLDPRITFARGSTATYYNSSGLIASAASGAPRFDYAPVTLAPRGLLLEEQRTNLVLYSMNLTPGSGYWSAGGSGTTTGNAAVAPDGTTTATLLTGVGGAGPYMYALLSVSAVSYIHSIYIKKGTADFAWLRLQDQAGSFDTTWFNLTTGAVGTSQAPTTITGIENVGGGWFRIWCGRLFPAGGSYYQFGLSDADASLNLTAGFTGYFWGAQAEPGSFPTSYIPTTSAAVTRAADTAEMTGTNFSSWYNQPTGTFIVELLNADAYGATITYLDVNSSAGPLNDLISFRSEAFNTTIEITTGGVGQIAASSFSGILATPMKLGVAYASNDAAFCQNAGTVGADATVVVPTVDQLWIGRGHLGSFWLVPRTWFKRLTYYNTRKSNSELQALTAPPPVGTGVLAAQAAVLASTTGVSGSLITDTTLNASAAVLSSTTGISGSLITDTTLNANSAALSSTTGVSGSLITDTTLNASAAVVSSTTGLVRAIGNASALTAQAATVIGLGTGAGAATIGAGALSSPPATMVGAGLLRAIGAGALADGSAALSALAITKSIGAGALAARTSIVAGLGEIEVGGMSINVGGAWKRSTPYVRVGGSWKATRAFAKAGGVWKQVA